MRRIARTRTLAAVALLLLLASVPGIFVAAVVTLVTLAGIRLRRFAKLS